MSSSVISLSVRRERLVLWLLAGLQFTHLLDFMILSPLSPQLMRLWGISASQFGTLVSVYALAAAVAGLAATFVIDRFDRRAALLAVYALFIVATLACALAPGFWFLLVARVLAGASGGVVGSIVMAIVGDLVPPQRRGRAMGVVMSAFPVVSVMGVPAGLLLAGHFGWHAPFYVLAVLSLALGVCVPAVVPKVAAHVHAGQRPRGVWRTDFTALLRASGHGRALGAVFIFTLSGFMLYPFLSAFQVKNVGIGETELAWVFFCGGLATIVTSRLIGWSADRFGKRRMFLILAWCSIAPILVTTHMPRASVWMLIAATTPFMVLMSGRFIPLMALVSMCVNAPMRGAFMSLSSAVQNLAAGIASVLAGAMIGHTADGMLTGFGDVGITAAALTVVCIVVARKLRPAADVGSASAAAA